MAQQRISIPRPTREEYDDYHETYVAKVGPGPVLSILEAQRAAVASLLARIDGATADYRYADGKWSVKEVVGHLVDTERVFACRALWFARGERQPLPGMDPDAFVAAGDFGARNLSDLAAEAELVRRSTIALFAGFSESQLARRGTASGCDFTTRSIAFVIAGHERHHLDVLEDRYGLGAVSRR